jgi:membrane-associated phospholipid phosphatase
MKSILPAVLPAILFALSLSGASLAQTPEDEGEAAPEADADGVTIVDGDYLASYPENARRILISPFLFDRRDWLAAGLVAGATGALILLDEEIRDFWQDDLRGSTSDGASDVFRQFGAFGNLALGSLGAYALAEAFGARREKAASLLALESIVLSSTLIAGIKVLSGRERPEDEADALAFEGLPNGGIDDAFPSGHSGRAFAMAAVVSEIYGPEHPWVPWLAYPIAAGTALSRVNDDRHWASDVFLGGVLGTLVGKLVVRGNPFLARNGIDLEPFHQDGASGLNVTLRF